jgi:hypothetical protein
MLLSYHPLVVVQCRPAATTRCRHGTRHLVDAVKAGRKELMEMREPDVINDEVMRVLQVDIDLEETLIVGATRHER